jgi:two-component system chemotaxis response regulator CheY
MESIDFAVLKILVVEDEACTRTMIVRLLRGFGCTAVAEAADGAAALQALDQRPDLIICDIAIKPGDGFALLADIRRHPGASSTPVIFLAAHNNAETVRKAIAFAVDGFLVKPVQPGLLRERIEAALRRTHRADPAP